MVFKSFFEKKDGSEKNSSQQDGQSQQKSPQESKHVEYQKNEGEESNNENPPVSVQLEKAMADNIKQDTQESRSKVYQELLFSDIMLALVDTPDLKPGAMMATPEQPQNLNVAIMSNPQGVQFAATFTSAEAAKLWRPEGGQYVSIRGQEIFKLLELSPAEVIVVNPGSSPFIALSKAEFVSLAQGVVPQTAKSPVQAIETAATNQPDAGMQISFPPDAFSESQKDSVKQFLSLIDNIEAAALGALLPPNSAKETDWLRTIFLRTKSVQTNPAEIQKFCIDIRDQLTKSSQHFKDVQFEVGVMPDDNFWLAVNQNNFTLFDKKPPKSAPVITPQGVRRA